MNRSKGPSHHSTLLILLGVALLTGGATSRPTIQSKIGTTAREAPPPVRVAQTAPGKDELAGYQGLHAAAAKGDVAAIGRLVSGGADLNAQDGNGRTPLMVAAHLRHHAAARALIKAGANVNALDKQQYDTLTIAAVANDLEMVKLAIASGADTGLVTSPYQGTALIASAHLGHVEVVRALIAAKAPLDHVNNLGWTALIEAIVLGDGGSRHVAIVRALIKAGANVNLPDSSGTTPLGLARRRGYAEIARILEQAGARP
jgi:ankyrin repeat protein